MPTMKGQLPESFRSSPRVASKSAAGPPSGPGALAFNRSPMCLVKHVRLERAAKLLSLGQSPIEQIAHRVGFSSRSHFSQAFKEHTGRSPAEFREAPVH